MHAALNHASNKAQVPPAVTTTQSLHSVQPGKLQNESSMDVDNRMFAQQLASPL
jgi:hypothetical protein